jgi:hypothetical protein
MTEPTGKSFNELLNDLIALYRKLRDASNTSNVEVGGDVDFLLEHYETIKDNIDEETFESLGNNIKPLLENLVEQLKDEMKEDPDLFNGFPEPSKPKEKTVEDRIKEIDARLAKKDLSLEEIDELLDQRSKL